MNYLKRYILLAALFGLALRSVAPGQSVSVPPASRSTIDLFDLGYAWITELRRASIPSGGSELVFESLPSSMHPGTAEILPSPDLRNLAVRTQRFMAPKASRQDFLEACIGREVEAVYRGVSSRGVLLAVAESESPTPDVLLRSASGQIWVRDVDSVRLINAEGAPPEAESGAQLVWQIEMPTQVQAPLRLRYRAGGWSWNAVYMAIMDPDARRLHLSGRAGVVNRTDREYTQARISLNQTEQGRAGPLFPRNESATGTTRLRYGAAGQTPRFEQQLASVKEVNPYTLPGAYTVPARSETYISFLDEKDLPYRMTYVYDGVVFDQFRRYRRNDWNYGTESHDGVEMFLTIDGLPRRTVELPLPAGDIRVFRQQPEGGLMLMGDQRLPRFPQDTSPRIRIGQAPHLKGDRQRVGYTEITPLHEYEESFEIRITNSGDDPADVRVVEHLYRWPEYEIVKADADYEADGPQRIVFPIQLQPGGSRTLDYTVRYRW